MRYFSCFSGIEAASVAWEPLGWTPVGFSEIDPFASAVLAHRFPNVRNYGDITKHHEWDIGRGSVDILVGGSPCQAFSVAGLRKGLDDPRGQLTLVYLQLAARLEPEWIVWENVPGVLSADGGRAFGAFLGGLAELGYGFAWRVLDARFFGVPQRRRRVFLVARRAGDWQRPAEVLLEPAGLCWNPAASGEARKDAPSDAAGGTGIGSWWDGSDCSATLTKKNADGSQRMPDKGNFGAVVQPFTGSSHAQYRQGIGTLRASGGDLGGGSENIVVQPTAIQGNLIGRDQGGPRGWSNHMINPVLVPHAFYSTGGTHGLESKPDVCPPLKVGSTIGIPSPPAVAFTDIGQGQRIRSADGVSETLRSTQRGPYTDFYTIDMQGCEGNANVGDGSVSPTLGRPSGTDCHAVAFYSKNGSHGTIQESNIAPSLKTASPSAVAIPIDGRNAMRDLEKHDEVNLQGVGVGVPGDPAHTVTTACVHAVGVDVYNQQITGDTAATVTSATGVANASGPKAIAPSMVVRRLLPVECERLQGFPDGWTDVPYRGKPAPDGPRYKALGNSMAVPCMAWIGRRIQFAKESEQ